MATQTLSIERSQAGLSFLLQWILAFTVSFAVGGAVGKAFGMRAGFVVSGLIIIGLQWLVLRKQVPQAGLLALAGATGFAMCFLTEGIGARMLGEAVGGTIGPLVTATAAGFGMGISTGIAQSFVLRRLVAGADRWELISIASWALAMAVGFVVGQAVGGSMTGVVGKAVAGTVVGAISGVALAGLLRHPLPQPKSI